MAGSLTDTISKFNQTAAENQRKLNKNPFSDDYQPDKHKVTDERYGRPEAGSKTEKRGIKADKYGKKNETGQTMIKFGYLFNLYATYSDKVVGMLLRARKHGLVQFEGEMLYQRQDDEKEIVLLKSLEEIKESLKHSGDPKHCIKFESKK